MKRNIFIIVLILLCLGATVFLLLANFTSKSNVPIVEINNKVFQVELAKTPEEQARGLSNRDILADNSGMLFIFPNYQTRFFWMKDMRFSLDIIWIKDNQVVGCEKEVAVFQNVGYVSQVSSPELVNYVLEVNSGICKKYEIKAGDKVEVKGIGR